MGRESLPVRLACTAAETATTRSVCPLNSFPLLAPKPGITTQGTCPRKKDRKQNLICSVNDSNPTVLCSTDLYCKPMSLHSEENAKNESLCGHLIKAVKENSDHGGVKSGRHFHYEPLALCNVPVKQKCDLMMQRLGQKEIM